MKITPVGSYFTVIKKAAITIDDDVLVFNRPSIYSAPKVILKKGRLCKIKKCKDEWCYIAVDKFKGWIKKRKLMGIIIKFYLIYFVQSLSNK